MLHFVFAFSFLILSQKVWATSIIDEISSSFKSCETFLPLMQKNGAFHFCTGIKIEENEWKKFQKMTIETCAKNITDFRYKFAILPEHPASISQKDFDQFEKSTQRALTFHPERIVLMKKSANRIDCLHELIHVYQWMRSNDAPLSPFRRKKLLDEGTEKLSEALLEVQKLEKNHQLREAQNKANEFAPLISSMKKLSALSDSLDEIEPYYFILHWCSELNCSDEDREIALANLEKRKNALPPLAKNEIRDEIKKILTLKERPFIMKAKMQWDPLTDSEWKEINQLWDIDENELIKKAKVQGINLIHIDLSSFFPVGVVLSENFFKNISSLTDEQKKSLSGSALLKGLAIGKFECDLSQKTTGVIYLTSSASRATLIHEWIHAFQSRHQKTYCSALQNQNDVAQQFSSGKITKEEYESKILYYQAMNRIAENEVYSYMTMPHQKKKQTTLENINNEEMLKQYLIPK